MTESAWFPVKARCANHFGLLDMRERTQSMGSKIQIVSEAGSGTRIELEVVMKP
jgi:signal transduction histidine kinase